MDTDVHQATARRRGRAAAPLAAALAGRGLLPAAPGAAEADRGPIAYTRLGMITLVGEAGGPATQLMPGAQPAWSPDGTRLAYLTGSFGGPYSTVSIANADGSGRRDLVSVSDASLFLSQPTGVPTTFMTFDYARAGDPERLSGPAWSPDGTQVRFAVLVRKRARLLSVDVLSGRPTVLAEFELPRGEAPRDIAWSPAGRLVAFSAVVTRRGDTGCRGGEHRLYTYRVGAPAARRVAAPARFCPRRPVSLRYPAFSPDGTRVVATRVRPGRRSDLVTIDVGPGGRALGDMRPTAPRLAGVHRAAFSPDGQRIAYLFARRDGEWAGGVAVMRADGTGRQVVARYPTPVLQDPDWGYAPRPPA
jgi:Tol biopolymer transport system component